MKLVLPDIRAALAGYDAERIDPARAARHAAVAAVLRPVVGGAQADVEVLLMRRASRDGDPWSGHVSFPGGHLEGEEDFEAAARRETFEEVGLDLGRHGRLIGELDHTHAYARGRRVDLIIAPIVYELTTPDPVLRGNHEVAETFWAPLGAMARGDLATTLEYETDEGPQRFPGYDVDGRVVWGLTYRMLGTLFAVLGQR